jgi:hypothetical protein
MAECMKKKNLRIRLGCEDISRLPATGKEKPYEELKLGNESISFWRHPELLLNRYWTEWLNKKSYYQKYGAPKYEDRTAKDIQCETYYDYIENVMQKIVRQRQK